MTATAYAVGTAVINRLMGGTAVTTGNSGDDARITGICSSVNIWMDTYIGRAVAPDDAATYTFDGYAAYDQNKGLYISNGIRSITTMTIATTTVATPGTVNSSDYHISPRVQDRRTDSWPGFEVRMHDFLHGTIPIFWPGYGNISITGNFGWAAIPDDLADVAQQIVVRIWAARMSGQSDMAGTNEFGQMLISRYISPEDKGRIRIYKEDALAVG
jgi:hypothetical protein